MKKYKQKVRKNQKIFTFYLKNGKLNPKNNPTPQREFITYFAKEAPPLYGLLF